MFVIEVPYMNLEQIYNSLQVPRWIKLKENKFVVIHKNKALKIEQNKERFIMNCSEDEFFNIWFDYFDLKTDYKQLNDKIKRLGKKFKIIANRGKGIHILNQDYFETYIYSEIAEKVGYGKAYVAINHIAEVCGVKHVQAMREAGRITWYEFPGPEMILENFDKLKKMGKINIWLKSLCESLVKGELFAANDLYKLFDMHDSDVFPLIGIEDTLVKNFDCEPEEFADWYLDEIENKGLVYMYILHHITNPPKEKMTYGVN